MQKVLDLLARGQTGQARRLCQGLLFNRPGDVDARHLLALVDLQEGKPQAAAVSLEKLCREAPKNADLWRNLGVAELSCGNPDRARESLEQGLALAPKNAELAFNAGVAAAAGGDRAAARSYYERAVELQPRLNAARNNLGALLVKEGEYGAALPHLEAATATPGAPDIAHCNHANALERVNRLDEAVAALARVRDGARPEPTLVGARLARRRGQPEQALARLRAFLAKPTGGIDAGTLGDLWQQVALSADLVGDHAAVLPAAAKAKERWRQLAPEVDGAEYLEHLAALGRTAELPRLAPGEGSAELPAGLVFFVGFPRSGTTLMENLLAADPGVRTTAEADYLHSAIGDLALAESVRRDDLLAARKQYLDNLRADCHRDRPDWSALIVVDKLPLNIVYGRWIDVLFPEAKLLVALRDPRDAVLSCLLQRFRPNPAMRNLDSLAAAAKLYRRAMELWLEARDGLEIPWLEYRYEDLAGDSGETLKQVLEFVGLEADPLVLDARRQSQGVVVQTPSYERVAEAIDTSAVARWRNYATDFTAVHDDIAPFLEAFAYE
ncbi:MAG: sulfotransferase [Alphaproteobacteria bacterium]|jgi:Tfp pilus assembly protein PilF|nr:sulfotransferase [Alphaproteobacteria bacterium]